MGLIMLSFTINQATFADIKELCLLEQASFDTDLITARQYRDFIKKASAEVTVVRVTDKIIGCAIVLYRKNSTVARLYSIAIDKDFHGKNMAQSLLDAIEQQAILRDCNEMRLEVSVNNLRAISFYEKNSYQCFSQIKAFYENGDDALRMHKIFVK